MHRSTPPSAESAELRQYIRQLLATEPPADLQEIIAGGDHWSIKLDTAHILRGLVRFAHPKGVLEFGAGRSSLVIASTLQTMGGGRLTTIEHEPRFAEEAWRQIEGFTAVDARLVQCPLGIRFSKHGLLHEYLGVRDAFRGRGPFDFLFIDAPPGHLGRDATLLAAAPFLSPGAIVILDDASRPQEQTALRRWERAVDVERIFESSEIGGGVAVLTVAHASRAAFSLRTFAGTVHDRFNEQKYRRESPS